MPLAICPGCRQNVPEDAVRCPACGWERSTYRDLSANRFITWFLRGAFVISVAGVMGVNYRYGVSPLPAANFLGGILLIASLTSYVVLRLLMIGGRRKVWKAALGTALLLTGGLHVTRVLMQQGAVPMISLSLSGREDTPAPAPATQPVSAQPVVIDPDDYQPLLRIANKAFATIRQQPQVLTAELEAAGVSRMTSPATLVDIKRVIACRQRIKRLYGRLNWYESIVNKAPRNAVAQCNASDATDAAKTRFLKAFDATVTQAARNASGYITFERQSLAQIDALLALAESKRGHLAIRRGNLVFADKQDQVAFAVLYKQIAANSARQSRLVSKFWSSNDPSMKRLSAALDLSPGPGKPAAPKRTAQASVAE